MNEWRIHNEKKTPNISLQTHTEICIHTCKYFQFSCCYSFNGANNLCFPLNVLCAVHTHCTCSHNAHEI